MFRRGCIIAGAGQFKGEICFEICFISQSINAFSIIIENKLVILLVKKF